MPLKSSVSLIESCIKQLKIQVSEDKLYTINMSLYILQVNENIQRAKVYFRQACVFSSDSKRNAQSIALGLINLKFAAINWTLNKHCLEEMYLIKFNEIFSDQTCLLEPLLIHMVEHDVYSNAFIISFFDKSVASNKNILDAIPENDGLSLFYADLLNHWVETDNEDRAIYLINKFNQSLINKNKFIGILAKAYARKSNALYKQLKQSKVGKKVVVIAGMRHSGSTALFNIVRLACEYGKINCFAEYSEHTDYVNFLKSDSQVIIIKTHEFRQDIYDLADVIITTRRDIRDTVASAKRRNFGMLKKHTLEEYAQYNMNLWKKWCLSSDYEFSYSDFMETPEKVIDEIILTCSIDNTDKKRILKNIHMLPVDQYDKTKLTPSHITDPKRIYSYSDTLEGDTINNITNRFNQWLNEYGYL